MGHRAAHPPSHTWRLHRFIVRAVVRVLWRDPLLAGREAHENHAAGWASMPRSSFCRLIQA